MLCVSEFIAKQMQTQANISPKQTAVVRNCINEKKFQLYNDIEKQEIREKFVKKYKIKIELLDIRNLFSYNNSIFILKSPQNNNAAMRFCIFLPFLTSLNNRLLATSKIMTSWAEQVKSCMDNSLAVLSV